MPEPEVLEDICCPVCRSAQIKVVEYRDRECEGCGCIFRLWPWQAHPESI